MEDSIGTVGLSVNTDTEKGAELLQVCESHPERCLYEFDFDEMLNINCSGAFESGKGCTKKFRTKYVIRRIRGEFMRN